MLRKVMMAAAGLLATAGGTVGIVAPPAGAATLALNVSQSVAFGYLGHSCGGIQETSYATGFDPASGYPVGDVHLSTSCGGSGRGGGYKSTTYAAWIGVTWDFTTAVVASSLLSSAPSTDPGFLAFDAYGNEVYNASNSAFLVLGPGYAPAPRVTGISVATGPSSGGTVVTITGDGFTGATAVGFGSATSPSVTVASDTSLTAVTPATAPGVDAITVTGPGGTSAPTSAAQYTFVATPVVTGLSPNSSPLAGGTAVTITGSGLLAATTVSFGDQAVGFSVIDDSTLVATSPAVDTADTAQVTVSSIGGTSATSSASTFTYVAAVSSSAPVVSKLSPNWSPPAGGATVTITGKNFTGATAVDFGSTPASSITVVSGTSITAVAPPGTGMVDLTVANGYGTSAVVAADSFSYGPLVSKISPNKGSAGGETKVTITGHNFLGTTGVTFGGQDALSFTVASTGSSIVAYAPPEIGTGVQTVDVVATNPDGTSPIVAGDRFTYAVPVVSALMPSSGAAGGHTTVMITGQNLYGATAVTFGGVPAVSFSVTLNGTKIMAVTPPEATTGVQAVDVSVTTAAGTGTRSGGFTYAAPTVSALSSVSGPAAGGKAVTITGTNLYGAVEVDFGSSAATITKESATSVTVIAPAGSGTVDVTVTTAAGTSVTSAADQYSYV
jgi:hypothetical protein